LNVGMGGVFATFTPSTSWVPGTFADSAAGEEVAAMDVFLCGKRLKLSTPY
jgi:hypothetical protein